MLKRLVCVIALMAAPVWAADEAKRANCAATRAIVAEAVAHRLAGQRQAQAVDYLRSDEAGVDDRYDQTIPMLVGWVYGLEQAQVTPEVAEAFEAQCLDYDG